MKVLTDAIFARFAAASLGSTLTGGIHADEAPPSTAMPYLVYQPIAAPLGVSYGAVNEYDATIQFTVVAVGRSACQTAMAAVLAAYDNTPLTLASGTNHHVVRLGEPVAFKQEPTDGNGDDAWQASCEIQYSVHRTTY